MSPRRLAAHARAGVIAALVLAGPSCRRDRSVEDLDELIAALADPSADERAMAAWDLAKLGPAARPALEPLARASLDPDANVRSAALAALAVVGPDAAPAIVAALRHDPAGACKSAIDALSLHPAAAVAAGAVPLLVELHRDAVPVRCGWTTEGLFALGEASVAPLLAEAGRTATEDLFRLVQVLARIGAPALPALFAAAEGKDRSRRLVAVQSLRAIPADAARAGPLYVRLLADPEREIRLEAAVALGELGPAFAPGFPALAARLEDDAVRSAANGAFLGHPETALRVLVPLVSTPDPVSDPEGHRRLYAVSTLGSLGEAARPVAPALAAAAARDPASGIRLEALRALRSLHAGPEVLPDVIAALADPAAAVAEEAHSYLRAHPDGPRALEKAITEGKLPAKWAP